MRPPRDASSKGHIVLGFGTSKGRIVQGTEHPRLFVRGHKENFTLFQPAMGMEEERIEWGCKEVDR
jgi:hypothetical protein